jgi:hypothetical protein
VFSLLVIRYTLNNVETVSGGTDYGATVDVVPADD